MRDGREKLLVVEGLFQKESIPRCRQTSFALSPRSLVTRDQNDRQPRLLCRNTALECPTVHPWHTDIANQACKGLGRIRVEERSGRRESTHGVTCRLKQVFEGIQYIAVVVDDTNSCIRRCSLHVHVGGGPS